MALGNGSSINFMMLTENRFEWRNMIAKVPEEEEDGSISRKHSVDSYTSGRTPLSPMTVEFCQCKDVKKADERTHTLDCMEKSLAVQSLTLPPLWAEKCF
ncbi:hypothetical protein PoB_000170500 [Plakobranchus ocellatus]|uniref:Uncharacterized protein n=1 Tax=Plakobranchus ocellatus TaxID=259542 RepID=A0AAV3XWL8_9GAST|nr:hypothetical protein PoB_000170500 [Plakobranchus ocellatus]